MGKKKIKIAGAGLAGLTAAVNLAKAGFEAEVYEKCPRVGQHYKENPQLLPNWFARDDVIEELERCNIKINWIEKIERVEVFLPNQKIIFSGGKIPVGYTVLRGGENSFEAYLAKQAESLGVKIITNSHFDIDKQDTAKPDIIATGEGVPITVGYGQVYKGEFDPKKVKVFFNPNHSSSVGYDYFFPHNRTVATIKTSRNFIEKGTDLRKNLEELKKDYLPKEIKEENFLYDFGTKRSFQIPESATAEHSLLAGEAAGFQDELFRFGMRYAVISGFLAAKSIIEDISYDKLWKERFSKEFQRTKKTRRILEDLKRKNFNNFPEKLEISVGIERFKKLWLSKKTDFLLTFYPLYRSLLLSFPIPRSVFKTLLYLT